MTYLVLAGMLALVLSPVLIPAIITAVHAIRGTNRPATTTTFGHPRPAVA
jgi:hypothetical protein